MQSQAPKFRLTGMGRNSQAVKSSWQEQRSGAQPEVTRHPPQAETGLRRPGFQIRKPGARNLQGNERQLSRFSGMPEAGSRMKCGGRFPDPPPGRDITENAVSSQFVTCPPADREVVIPSERFFATRDMASRATASRFSRRKIARWLASLAPAWQQDPGARNGRFNSSRFRVFGPPWIRSPPRLSPPSLVALVPLRVPSQPPVRPQQTRRLRPSRRNHGLGHHHDPRRDGRIRPSRERSERPVWDRVSAP